MLPNFIIGGTSAGGTSFLANAMIQHPDIYLPKQMRPEPHFFYKSWEYEKSISYYEKKYFSEVGNEFAIGERSSSYLFSRESAVKISRHIPNVKLIFVLRNPIERTYANYRYTVLEGLETLSFEDALQQEEQRIKKQEGVWKEIQPYNYTGRGFYGIQIEAYLDFFSAEQLYILKSENLNNAPYASLEGIFDFLGVDTSFKPKLPSVFTSLNVKNRELQVDARCHFGGEQFDKIIEAIRKGVDPLQCFDDKKQTKVNTKIIYDMQKNLTKTKEKMSEDTRVYLKNLFAEDMIKLKQYINFEVEDWR